MKKKEWLSFTWMLGCLLFLFWAAVTTLEPTWKDCAIYSLLGGYIVKDRLMDIWNDATQEEE